MKTDFRVTGIKLDDDEELAAVTALASGDALRVLRGMGGPDLRVQDIPASRWHVVDLDLGEMRKLRDATGKMTHLDPQHAITTQVYDSLCLVLYALLDD